MQEQQRFIECELITLQQLRYDELRLELELDGIFQLEDIIVEAMERNLLVGTMDQRNGVLKVNSTMGRDVNPENYAEIYKQLGKWYFAVSNCRSLEIEKTLKQMKINSQAELLAS